jgi:hypothetical protein
VEMAMEEARPFTSEVETDESYFGPRRVRRRRGREAGGKTPVSALKRRAIFRQSRRLHDSSSVIWQRSVRLGLLQKIQVVSRALVGIRARGSNASHQRKNEQNDEDQSEATTWIISDFSEEEAMARRSA